MTAFPPPPGRRGFALVLILSTLALVATLVLAFFSRARLAAQITYSSSNQLKADLLCRAASEIVVGEVREEIRGGSRTVAGGGSDPACYLPLAATNAVPQTSGLSSPDAAGAATLLKVSAAGRPVNPYPGGRVLASGVATDAASLNGRVVPAAAWFGTGVGQGPCLGSQGTAPTWAYVTRGGVTNAPVVAAPLSDPAYATGRFAYAVYDIGGLLDANAAGYAPGALASAPFKGSAAYADLGQVPGVDAQTFVGWRNGGDAGSAAAYDAYLRDYGLKNGFLSAKAGDNAFLSRQDLIRVARNGGCGLGLSSLPYLTQFSRTRNAPSWTPPADQGTGYAYQSNADNAASANRNAANVRFAAGGTVTHYRDDGTTETYSAAAGDPLLQRRFSLARLAWLTPSGVAAGIPAAAVQAAFGLAWDAGNARWVYVGANGTGLTPLSSIETLAQAALENREPDFFELLKAAVLSGSVGASAQAKTAASSENQAFDAAPDLQVVRIGANIVDAADADNLPTRIAFAYSGSTVESAGIEDLPYLYGMFVWELYKPNAGNTTVDNLDLVFFPILLNPHRASASAATSSPSSVAVDIAAGTLRMVFSSNYNSAPYTANSVTLSKSLATASGDPALQAIQVASAGFEGYRRAPQVVRSASAANRLGALVPYATGTQDVQVFRYFSGENEAVAHGAAWPWVKTGDPSNNGPGDVRAVLKNLVFRLRYTVAGGTYTYQTLCGNEGLPAAQNGGILNSGADQPGYGTGAGNYTDVGGDLKPAGNLNLNDAHYWCLFDPRTNRFGPCIAYHIPDPLNILPDTTTANGPITNGPALPFPGLGTGHSPLGLWPGGGLGYAAYNTPDPDGVFRPADGWLSAAANPYLQVSGGALNTTDESRPVILQRPFRSVAELGYVFRDSAWKTLSFFDATSGDAALLDFFSLTDEPAVGAGKASLASRQPLTLQALFSGTALRSDGTSLLSATAAQGLATAFASYAYSSGAPTAAVPGNPAAFPAFLGSSQAALTAAGIDGIKWHQEAPARAIAGATQTRTWNLLVDVTAQTGHFPAAAHAAGDFLVEGEKRYWLSVAIDRYTGEVVARQMEPVYP